MTSKIIIQNVGEIRVNSDFNKMIRMSKKLEGWDIDEREEYKEMTIDEFINTLQEYSKGLQNVNEK